MIYQPVGEKKGEDQDCRTAIVLWVLSANKVPKVELGCI